MSSTLVTFVVTAYQQEKYVREALEAALAQEYQPLEVLVLDDASTDRTPDIIQDIIARYRGPHAVRFIRNEQNVGTREQFNRAAREASGRLLVHGAGDDVSLPERTERVVNLWRSRNALVIVSNSKVIDERGSQIGVLLSEQYAPPSSWQRFALSGGFVPGCALAWDRQLYDIFGDVPLSAVEDSVICMRALLAGGVAYDPMLAVNYRRHGNNFSSWVGDRSRDAWADYCWWTNRYACDRVAVGNAWLTDIELYFKHHEDRAGNAAMVSQMIRNERDIYQIRSDLCRDEPDRLRNVRRLWRARQGVPPKLFAATGMWLLLPTTYRVMRQLTEAAR